MGETRQEKTERGGEGSKETNKTRQRTGHSLVAVSGTTKSIRGGGIKTTETTRSRPQEANERNEKNTRLDNDINGHRRNKTVPGTIDSGPTEDSKQTTVSAVQLEETTRAAK